MSVKTADVPFDFSAADKLAEIEREIEVRKRVYPKFIAQGSLSLVLASKRIDIMRAIAHDYFQKTQSQPDGIGKRIDQAIEQSRTQRNGD
jgi:hypothetical protein